MALYQAGLVKDLLIAAGCDHSKVTLSIIKTSGDRLKGKLADFGGKGLFTKELEEALLDGSIDLAVHSMKDVPTTRQAGLEINAYLPRADVRDAFICPRYSDLSLLPKGAVIGTASLRRRAQLSALRPDLRFTLLRGNVGTRLEKLQRGECDATILAAAGLTRLGQEGDITALMSESEMLPAPAQGIIGVEMRAGETGLEQLLAPLNDRASMLAAIAERAFLAALDGNCRTPIAALARIDGMVMHFCGQAFSRGQSFACETRIRFSEDAVEANQEAAATGKAMADEILRSAGSALYWEEI